MEFFEPKRGGKTLEQALSAAALLSLRSMIRHRAFVLFLLVQAQSSHEQADVVFREITDRWTAMFQTVIDQRVPLPESSAAPLVAQQLVDILLASFIRNEFSASPSPDLEAYVLDAVQTVIMRVGDRPHRGDQV
jgi:hypothetical protein